MIHFSYWKTDFFERILSSCNFISPRWKGWPDMCTGAPTTNIFRRLTVISRHLLQIKRCNPLRGCILVGPAGFEPTQWRSQSPLPYRLATAQQKKRPRSIITVRSLVGCLERFELSASRATIWRANQLRHRHHIMRPKGLEPPAHCLEGSCSIHLSYGRTLLSHGVLIWRQCAFGTRCEKYNTIHIGFCQAEFQIFLDFPAQGAFWGHSRYIPAAPRAKPSRAPAATSRT